MRSGWESRTCKKAMMRRQRGYMLLTLMLGMALMTLGMLALLPAIGEQIRRDREEELLHRGTQYMRAIQHYYHKFGRYPTRLEDLEGTNNTRFLRKRYKDPMSREPESGREADFKIVHLQDVVSNNVSAPGQSLAGQGSPGQGLPGQGKSTVAGNSDSPDSSTAASEGDGSDSTSSTSPNPGASPASATSSTADPGGQTFGGGAIVGVASKSKQKTIRVFNDKNHYSDWYFIYDTTALAQGLLVGPWRPSSIVLNGGPVMAPGQATSNPAAGQSNIGPGALPPAQQNSSNN